MNSRARKQTLTVVAVFAVVCMLASQLLAFPQRTASAAGTDLYVGYTGKANNFSTVQDAVNKAASLNPSNENSRVTIHIAPGTYRQQVVVQTPYITFVNDEPQKGDDHGFDCARYMLNKWIAKGDINNFVDEEKMDELMSALGDDDDDMATGFEDDDDFDMDYDM